LRQARRLSYADDELMEKMFSHLDAAGAARMVNVGRKPVQRRRAVGATC
jgi:hypothetical protein